MQNWQSRATFNWTLYRKLISAQVRSQMQYRTSFVLETSAQFVGNVLDFVVVVIFFARMPALGGWTLPEIGLLYGLSGVAFGLSDMVIAGFDYAYFGPNMVRLGEFDRVLIRPVNVFLQVLTSQFTLNWAVSGRGPSCWAGRCWRSTERGHRFKSVT
jgi:ABC-2 type transport system permease protein